MNRVKGNLNMQVTWAELYANGIPEGFAGVKFPALNPWYLCRECFADEPEDHREWRQQEWVQDAFKRFHCDLFTILDRCDKCELKATA